MPASSHSLQLAAIVARASCGAARLMLVALTLGSVDGSIRQARACQPRAYEEPVMANHPRQAALGDALFQEMQL
jgi:hypothetical protein